AASDATADLCDLLESDQPASVRRNACIALGQVAGCSPDFLRAVLILTELRDEDPCHPVRVEAEAALTRLLGPPTQPDDREPTLAPPSAKC
ncbi:MAG: hypothetical protein ACYTFQ_27955, partial [Planctomycetota bacterium]